MKDQNYQKIVEDIAKKGGLQTSGNLYDPMKAIELEGNLYRSIKTASKKDKLWIKFIKIIITFLFIVPSTLLSINLANELVQEKEYTVIPLLILSILFGIPGFILLYRYIKIYTSK